MIRASIIVPTLNRANWLELAIRSLVAQDFPPSQYEILIVDNGCKDGTGTVAAGAAARHPEHNLRCVLEPEPGLLSARHRGALEAKAEILIFVDDDIEAVSGWLPAIMETFEDPSAHLVGGPSHAKFERDPPTWLRAYWKSSGDTFNCSPLSILSLGDAKLEIDPIYVWGLNFSIRKKTLFELGGFHPDCIPRHLQMFQGDGETGLSFKAKENHLKAFYAPGARVYHMIPEERLTFEYFEERFFYQGVCDSYTEIRKKRNLDILKRPGYRHIDPATAASAAKSREILEVEQLAHNAYVDGYLYHQDSVRMSPALFDWVLRKDYFDYRLPQLEKGFQPPVRRRSKQSRPPAGNAGAGEARATDPRQSLHEAASLVKSGRLEAALNELDAAVRRFPGLPGFQLSRAFCLAALNRGEESALACKAELDIDPGSRQARELLYQCSHHASYQPVHPPEPHVKGSDPHPGKDSRVIQRQLAEFERSPVEQRQSFHEHAKDPLKNLDYFAALKDRLIRIGVNVHSTDLDIHAFEAWLSGFHDLDKHYRNLKDVYIEKCLEHYIAHELLQLERNDRYIDIAASGSPWADILNKRGIEAYRLDLSYQSGIHGMNIGADAARTGLPSRSFNALSLQCSFECFMGNADAGFVKEASRILSKDGRYAIAPLYIEDTYFISSSPYCDQRQVIVDPGAIKVWRDDEYKVPFCRMYSPESFANRVYAAIPGDMRAKVIYFNNLGDLMKRYSDQRIYCFFALYCEKT